MMNGSIVLCDKIVTLPFNSRALCDLIGLRYAMDTGVTETLDVYAFFYPESLGQHHVEIQATHRETGRKFLYKFQDYEITERNIKNQGIFVIFAKDISIKLPLKGLYAFDLIVNGIIYASLSLKAV